MGPYCIRNTKSHSVFVIHTTAIQIIKKLIKLINIQIIQLQDVYIMCLSFTVHIEFTSLILYIIITQITS